MRVAGGMAIGLLVQKQFDYLEAMTSGKHMSAETLRRRIEAIGSPLVSTPDDEWAGVAVTHDRDSGGQGARFVAPLWTNEGRSGVGLAMRLVPTDYGTFDVEVEAVVEVMSESLSANVAQPVAVVSRSEEQDIRSDDPVPERWRPILGSLVHRLVIADYAGLAADGLVAATSDPTDTSIGRWIEDYPAHLVDLPSEAWDYSTYGQWEGAPESSWVIVPLWTAEEGRSDLSMEATIWDDSATIVARLDGVHVM